MTMGIRDAKPERQPELGGEGGSCTERRGVVISITEGVEGAEREQGRGLFYFLFLLFFIFISYIRC